MSEPTTSRRSMSSSGGSPARTSPSPVGVLDLPEPDPASGGSSTGSSTNSRQRGSSSKTSPVFCPLVEPTTGESNEDATWEYSSDRWQNSGTGGPTGCWTLNTSEFPND